MTPFSERILAAILSSYCGRLRAKPITCSPIAAPKPRITTKANSTVARTAAFRPTPRRYSQRTAGAKSRLSSTANAIGSSTGRAK